MHLHESTGWIAIAISALVLFSACQNRKIDNTMMVDPEEPVSFSEDVQPILTASYCKFKRSFGCVGDRSGFRVKRYAAPCSSKT
jgi:hypothetical protein